MTVTAKTGGGLLLGCYAAMLLLIVTTVEITYGPTSALRPLSRDNPAAQARFIAKLAHELKFGVRPP